MNQLVAWVREMDGLLQAKVALISTRARGDSQRVEIAELRVAACM